MSWSVKTQDLTMSRASFDLGSIYFGVAIEHVTSLPSNGDVVARVRHQYDSLEELLFFVRTTLRDESIQPVIDVVEAT